MASRAAVKKAAEGPSAADFEQLKIPFLNSAIRTSQSMAWFRDKVVLGTGRAPLGFMGRFTGRDSPRFGGDRADTGGRDEDGAQILTFDPVTGEWRKIYDSPTIISDRDGKLRARDRSIRASLVCQTASDNAPCLYLGAGSLEGKVVFLRSEDGETIEECGGIGFNLDADVPSVRAMACLDGRLFTSPTGKNYGRGMFDDNMAEHPIVFAADNPREGNWVATSESGFGDPQNRSINELIVFDNHLYAATLNPRYGFQLWKTDALGEPPYNWTKVIDRGAWLGATSSIPAAVHVFNGALYISATVQRQGRKGLDRFGPFPAELIRVYPDDSWELVSGTPRFTPHGFKKPVSGLSGGFGDPYTHAFWRMASHNGALLVGTAGWRWMSTYLRNREDLTEAQYARLREATEVAVPGEFAIWYSIDGVHWRAITRDGFPGSSPQNYGVREMLATPHGLFVAPTSKMGAIGGGGLELWWGRSV